MEDYLRQITDARYQIGETIAEIVRSALVHRQFDWPKIKVAARPSSNTRIMGGETIETIEAIQVGYVNAPLPKELFGLDPESYCTAYDMAQYVLLTPCGLYQCPPVSVRDQDFDYYTYPSWTDREQNAETWFNFGQLAVYALGEVQRRATLTAKS